MLEAGFKHGAQTAVAEYQKASKDVTQCAHNTEQRETDDAMKRINSEGAALLHCLAESLMSSVIARFP